MSQHLNVNICNNEKKRIFIFQYNLFFNTITSKINEEKCQQKTKIIIKINGFSLKLLFFHNKKTINSCLTHFSSIQKSKFPRRRDKSSRQKLQLLSYNHFKRTLIQLIIPSILANLSINFRFSTKKLFNSLLKSRKYDPNSALLSRISTHLAF
jgi:hypothetical protein